MAIVYIETNFLIGMSLGQDPAAADLLDEATRAPALQLVIPSICFMEALSAFEVRIGERSTLERNIRGEVRELERNRTSPLARQLLEQFNQSLITNADYTERIKLDFQNTIRRVRKTARMVALTKVNLRRGFAGVIVESKHEYLILPDNLIIHCILGDARSHAVETKAFLSGNSRDFSKPPVQEALRRAGIQKYFTEARSALGWYRSQPSA